MGDQIWEDDFLYHRCSWVVVFLLVQRDSVPLLTRVRMSSSAKIVSREEWPVCRLSNLFSAPEREGYKRPRVTILHLSPDSSHLAQRSHEEGEISDLSNLLMADHSTPECGHLV
jgi:hypothetical protein